MKREDLIKNCRYYKGEEKCPFPADDGRSVWWRIECYGVNADDKIDKGFSPTMINFLLYRVWESDSGWSTTKEEALKRAKELYDLGKWNAGYIANKNANISIAY